MALNGGGDVSGSINASAYLTANTLRSKAALYPTISFVKTNDNSESLLIVAGNNLYYRPVASDATNKLVYHSGNFNPSSKLDKSVWDEAFELKTVNGVRVISAKLDFLSVAGISAYATGPSSGGGGGGLDYDLLKQALTGAITPDGYPFTISASFLGAIDKTYLTGKLANTYANKVHTHLWTDITDRPTALPANGGNADTVDNLHGSSFAQIKSYTYPDGGINNITDLDFTGNIQAHFPGHEYSCIWQGKDFRGVIFQLKLKDYYTQSMMYRGGETKTWMTVWDSGNFNPANKFGFSADQLSDLNNAPNNAFFVGAYNATNSPVQNSWSNGFTIAYGNNTDFKKQFCYAGEKWWTRGRSGTNWGAWRQVWDSGNFNPANYLPLSGGSITGGLGVSGYLTAGVLRVKATSYPQISFVNTTTNRDSLLFVNGSELYWRPTAGTATDYQVYHSGNFNPDDYLPLSGGALTNTGNSAPLIITGSSLQACTKYMMNGSTVSGYFGVVAQGLNGTLMQYANGTISPSLIINNDAAPRFINTAGTQFVLYHSGNSNLSTVDWAAKNITAAGTIVSMSTVESRGNNSTGILPQMMWHIPGVTYARIRMASNGTLHVINGASEAYHSLYAQSFVAAGNVTAADTVTATKLVIGGITIDVYNGALRVNGNLVATGGVTAYQ